MRKILRSLTIAMLFGLGLGPLAGPVLTELQPAYAAGQPTRAEVVHEAMKYLGYPYAYTGSSPKTGFSCIGFVWYVFQSLGMDMPGNLQGAMAAFPRVRERDLIRGDIIFFKNTWWRGVSHVGIYIGHGKMINAENPHRGVTISYLRNDPRDGNYWQQHYLVAERPLNGPGAPSAPTTSRSARIGHATVTSASLDVRMGHGSNSIVVDVVSHGTRLSVIREWRRWFFVGVDGINGWVFSSGVRLIHDAGSSRGRDRHSRPTHQDGTATVIVGGLHVRRAPSTASSVVGSLRLRESVHVLSQKSGWDEISAVGVRGWSVSWGLRQGGPAKTRGRTQASSRLRSAAHLRAGPSLTSRILAVLGSGTRVVILKIDPRWDRVRVEGGSRRVGWVYASLIDKA